MTNDAVGLKWSDNPRNAGFLLYLRQETRGLKQDVLFLEFYRTGKWIRYSIKRKIHVFRNTSQKRF